MCGVVGLWTTRRRSAEEAADRVRAMSATLAHRGPDDSGVWVDPSGGVVLGHRRLSIIDLSSAGHQPMISACGRYALSFNGEIYHYRELRQELAPQGIHWRTRTDSEVLLEAVAHWGIDKALDRFNGMFAFALWDRDQRRLYLARDRLGKKPMYLYRGRAGILFASELKALCAHPDYPRRIDRRALYAVPAVPLRAVAILDLSGHRQAAPRASHDHRCQR